MDENAWTASKQEIEDHFQVLTTAYNPIYNRTLEYQNREKAYNESIQYFGAVYKKTSQLLSSHPWIADQVTTHLKKINDTVQAVNEKLKEQIARPHNEDPIIYVTILDNTEL